MLGSSNKYIIHQLKGFYEIINLNTVDLVDHDMLVIGRPSHSCATPYIRLGAGQQSGTCRVCIPVTLKSGIRMDPQDLL